MQELTKQNIAAAVRLELAIELAKITTGIVDANIMAVHNIPIAGIGADADPWRPA
jgi:hypothetical protein